MRFTCSYDDSVTLDVPSKLSNMKFYDSITVEEDEIYDEYDVNEVDSFNMAKAFFYNVRFSLLRTKICDRYKKPFSKLYHNCGDTYIDFHTQLNPSTKLSYKRYNSDSDAFSSYFNFCTNRKPLRYGSINIKKLILNQRFIH